MTEILNIEERDPKKINDYVTASYADVLAESDIHSFECSRNCCYKFLTLICGMPIALLWGCLYAFFSFEMIWCVTPALKLLKMRVTSFRAFYSMCLNTCLGPLYEIFGLALSNIRITITNKNGSQESNKDFGLINGVRYQRFDETAHLTNLV